MRKKSLFGTAVLAALLGWVSEASALPQFKLRIIAGTANVTFNGVIDPTDPSGTVLGAVNLNGGGGNKFTSNGLVAQGYFDYLPDGTLYMSLDVPDIKHIKSTAGSISFYLTTYDIIAPTGGPMNFKYDLSGFNGGDGAGNNSTGNFYYSATNSSNSAAIPNPGVPVVATPAVSTVFVSTPECQLAASDAHSYSCEDIKPVTLSPLYSLTQEITLNFAAGSLNLTSRGQSSTYVPYRTIPEPTSLALLGAGLLASARFLRRKKAGPKDV